jgi:hypothetical protein
MSREADEAAGEVLADYEVVSDPESASLAFDVAFDAEEAATDVPDGTEVDLGSDVDRLQRIAKSLSGDPG